MTKEDTISEEETPQYHLYQIRYQRIGGSFYGQATVIRPGTDAADAQNRLLREKGSQISVLDTTELTIPGYKITLEEIVE